MLVTCMCVYTNSSTGTCNVCAHTCFGILLYSTVYSMYEVMYDMYIHDIHEYFIICMFIKTTCIL